MTLFPSIPGLEAVVVVGGVDAQEYNVPEDENPIESLDMADYDAAYTRQGRIPHVVRYIEAKPGVDFLYRVTIKPNFVWRSHHVGARIQNDGVKGGMMHIQKYGKDLNGSIVRTMRGVTSGNPKEGYKVLTFRFAPVSLGMKPLVMLRIPMLTFWNSRVRQLEAERHATPDESCRALRMSQGFPLPNATRQNNQFNWEIVSRNIHRPGYPVL